MSMSSESSASPQVNGYVVGVGILPAQTRGDGFHFAGGLRERYARFEQRHRAQITKSASLRHIHALIPFRRKPQRWWPRLRLVGILKPLRRNADDGVTLAVDRGVAAHEIIGAAETALPQTVTDDDDGRMAGLFISRRKQAPALGVKTENVKEIGRNHGQIDALRFRG